MERAKALLPLADEAEVFVVVDDDVDTVGSRMWAGVRKDVVSGEPPP